MSITIHMDNWLKYSVRLHLMEIESHFKTYVKYSMRLHIMSITIHMDNWLKYSVRLHINGNWGSFQDLCQLPYIIYIIESHFKTYVNYHTLFISLSLILRLKSITIHMENWLKYSMRLHINQVFLAVWISPSFFFFSHAAAFWTVTWPK